MRIIVDMNLSPDWVGVLHGGGYEAVHWSTLGPQDSPDEDIVGHAESSGAVVLTRDLDFGAHVALSGRLRPSVVQLRAKRAAPAQFAELVLRALARTHDALAQGALVTIDLERVRLLPFPNAS